MLLTDIHQMLYLNIEYSLLKYFKICNVFLQKSSVIFFKKSSYWKLQIKKNWTVRFRQCLNNEIFSIFEKTENTNIT